MNIKIKPRKNKIKELLRHQKPEKKPPFNMAALNRNIPDGYYAFQLPHGGVVVKQKEYYDYKLN